MSQSLLPQPSADWALFLDFDGSIVELAETPGAVHVDAALLTLLERLEISLGGAVAIVSGRPIAQLDSYLAPHRFPTAGLHGLERRHANGTLNRSSGPNHRLRDIVSHLRDFAADHPGVLVEDKEATVALHYRGAPQFGDACREIMHDLVGGCVDDLGILAGKMVYEVKPANADKGHALDAFMGETPVAGRTPVFCGDDITDEPAFVAANELGGLSIRVGANGATAAQWRVADVGALYAWLETIAARLGDASAAGHR